MLKRRDILTTASAASLGALTTAAIASPKAPESRHRRLAPNVLDPSYVNPEFDSRSISFENPTGARGAGGTEFRGRKGHPLHVLAPGEKRVIADIHGHGTVRHIWMTMDHWSPQVMRALRLEVFYDGLLAPSISVPVLDFFGLPHGRLAEYYSALICVNEGRGLNFDMPMPFGRSVRIEFTNDSPRHVTLYYQVDYTLEPPGPEPINYLHATFRRENPTTPGRDFVIAEGLEGPGRYVGCAVGIRVLDKTQWYGEGEVKIYRDGDREFPTYCGTGLEDYVGSAYGLGRHYAPYSGAPINLRGAADGSSDAMPDLVGFYRWHLPDPIMFATELRVTIQQITGAMFQGGQQAEYEAFKQSHVSTGRGWASDLGPNFVAFGLAERSDDYCATAFIYCRQPQAVTRFTTADAVRDVVSLPVELSRRPPSADDDMDRTNAALKAAWNE